MAPKKSKPVCVDDEEQKTKGRRLMKAQSKPETAQESSQWIRCFVATHHQNKALTQNAPKAKATPKKTRKKTTHSQPPLLSKKAAPKKDKTVNPCSKSGAEKNSKRCMDAGSSSNSGSILPFLVGMPINSKNEIPETIENAKFCLAHLRASPYASESLKQAIMSKFGLPDPGDSI